MKISLRETSPTNKPPEKNFTGDVYISGYFAREKPSRLTGAAVTFTPGADSDDAAHLFRDDPAHRSGMMPPMLGRVSGVDEGGF